MSQFSAQIDNIHGRYRARYAGFPRITRDAEDLESILAEAAALAEKELEPEEQAKLSENVALYEKEIAGIREAQAQGPAALVAHRLNQWANYVHARYARMFAGKERRSRDLGVLAEMIDDADQLLAKMGSLNNKGQDLSQGIELTTNNLKIYRTERERIREDRKRVFGADRGTLFANLANDQFNRYRLHYAKKSRVSRSASTIKYITGALQEIADGMEALFDDGFNTTTHKKNIDLVKSNLKVYKAEKKNIAKALKDAPLNERVGALGSAANEVFKTYRENFAGKDRSTRDLELFHKQIELLLVVAKEMDEIDRKHDDDTNAKNLALVMDMLHLYHREYNLVSQQKA